MKKTEKMIPTAMEAVTSCGIAENNSVDGAFKGYISSFGASFISSGLLPSLIFFSSKGESKANRPAIIKAIEFILRKHNMITQDEKLLKLAEQLIKSGNAQDRSRLNRLSENITHAAIALKLAVRTFPEKE